MYLGQTGIKGLIAYGPWFPREGNDGTFGCELIDLGGNATLDIVIQQKDSDQADSAATTAASFTTISAAGVSEKRANNLNELVRFKFTVDGTADTDWVHFRMLDPQWEHN